MDSKGGFVPLPTILNNKTVDPQNGDSTKVIQLETAMGAAIECFAGAKAVCVDRSRFAPVKKCSDLLLLRSDAYMVNDENVLVLNPLCKGTAPIVDLDSKKYKLVQNLEAATRGGYPSLVKCKKLSVKGEVHLTSGSVFEGEVSISNTSDEPKVLTAGALCNTAVDLAEAPGLDLSSLPQCLRPHLRARNPVPGLRKKVKQFQEGLYLHNFVQATFNALPDYGTDLTSGGLLLGGDGRYYNDKALQVIIKMAVANGVKRIAIGKDGLLSTPAVSAIIRERGPIWKKNFGSLSSLPLTTQVAPARTSGSSTTVRMGDLLLRSLQMLYLILPRLSAVSRSVKTSLILISPRLAHKSLRALAVM